jgi:hypothetical protein
MFDRSLLEVFDDAVLDAPPEKVQLGARRREPLEFYALRAAKRVEELLTVTVQTRFVRNVNSKHLPRGCSVRHVVVLGVVGHEPLQFSE